MKNRVKAALVSAAAIPALALSATAASAGTSAHSGYEAFTIHQNLSMPNGGTVNMWGALTGYNGLDNETSQTTGTFEFRGGNVYVWHSSVPNPHINKYTCAGSLNYSGYWAFTGGTGKYRHAKGHGQFWLNEYLNLQKKHGQCDYNQNDEPAAFNLNVYAQGVASG